MSNVLINKFKTIDDSRARLKSILEDKGIQPSSTSLPGLVEDVNKLDSIEKEPIWEGVDTTEPSSYFTPEIDIDAIYEADTHKDSYTNVAIYLIKVSDYEVNLPQNVITSFTKYKFSDNTTLYSAVSTNQSPSHNWDTSKDIVGPSGEKYRYIIGYSNTTSYNLGYTNLFQPFALVGYKGTYTSLDWRNVYIAPDYTEIKQAVKFTGNINGVGRNDQPNYNAKTFICNAESALNIGDRVFINMYNMRYIKITSEITGNTGMYYAFANLRDAYVYIHQVSNLTHECIFAYTHNCTFIFDIVNTGTREETGFSWEGRALLNQARNVRIKIGILNGFLGQSWTASGGNAAQDIELEIDEIFGYVQANALHRDRIHCKHLKIGTVHGFIGSSAFYHNPLCGSIKITKNSIATDNPTIGASAFEDTDVECIDFSDSDIISIGDNAFMNCKKLKELYLGYKVTTIGNYILRNTPNITTLTLPDSVTTINSSTLNQSYVRNFSTGNKLTTIPAELFKYNACIENIILGDAVTTLGDSCFANTSNLKYIKLPENISIIPASGFQNSGIQKIEVLGKILTLQANCFNNCPDLKEIDLSSVETIAANCFDHCGLDVVIPNTLTSCAEAAFYGVKTLKFPLAPFSNLNLSFHGMDKFKILDLFYSLPETSTVRTITISPSAGNSVTNADRKFWTGIQNLYVHEIDGSLAYCSSSDSDAIKLATYVANKNYTIS